MTLLLAPCHLFPTLVAWYGPILPHYWYCVAICPHEWHNTASMTHITGTVWPFPTLVAWHDSGKYYHVTGTVWHFPQKWHGTANITTLLTLCGISHISGMIQPVLPRYWHCVAFSTLVAWHQWRSQGLPRVGESPTRKANLRKKMKENWGNMWENIGKWGRIEEMLLSCPPGSESLATVLHDTASITSLLAPCGIPHKSGMILPVWPHYWHRVAFPTFVPWHGQFYHIIGTVWPFSH